MEYIIIFINNYTSGTGVVEQAVGRAFALHS